MLYWATRIYSARTSGVGAMAMETQQFGPNQGITAHFLTQAGTVGGRRHAPSPEQKARAEAVGAHIRGFRP